MNCQDARNAKIAKIENRERVSKNISSGLDALG